MQGYFHEEATLCSQVHFHVFYCYLCVSNSDSLMLYLFCKHIALTEHNQQREYRAAVLHLSL